MTTGQLCCSHLDGEGGLVPRTARTALQIFPKFPYYNLDGLIESLEAEPVWTLLHTWSLYLGSMRGTEASVSSRNYAAT